MAGHGCFSDAPQFCFTAASPCENGMWVDANKANGEIKPYASTTKIVGVVYTAERSYEERTHGLKNFCQIAGDYPRVGILAEGDTITSNCFCYDTTEFANEAAMLTAVAAYATTALYVVPHTSGVPKLTATAPQSGIYGQVCKDYTMPNGEHGLKYQIVRV